MTTITDDQIEQTAKSVLQSTADVDTGRTSYLRTLLQAVQAAIPKGSEPKAQLEALSATHERFYAIVMRMAEAFVPRGTKDRAVELHRRANFARTAMGALRRYARSGGDILALKPNTVTKAQLRSKAGSPRPATARRLKGMVERKSKALMSSLIGLGDTDKAAAIEEMQLLLGQLTTQLVSLGVIATKDAAQALAEHRPLRIGKTLYMPTQTQIVRAQARPS